MKLSFVILFVFSLLKTKKQRILVENTIIMSANPRHTTVSFYSPPENLVAVLDKTPFIT